MAYSSADVQVPKYQQVLDSIKTDILSGRYRPGQKLPSEAALLKRFRTSRITVGRAVRELQQAGLVLRRAGSGTYVASASADDSGLLFGLLVPTPVIRRFSALSARACQRHRRCEI